MSDLFANCLAGTDLQGHGSRYAGKVRDCYDAGETLLLVASDRVSAFDRVIGLIPYKGQILTQLAAYWFQEMGGRFPNHFLECPDPAVTRVKKCTPFKLEMVVRAYLTGVTSTSIFRHYERGQREFGGVRLPDGMKKNQPLPQPLLTPSTKADVGLHDETVDQHALLERGLVSASDLQTIERLCLDLFAHASEKMRARGLLLVDTKYELGRDRDGRIVFIDEVHTPDSSRIWDAADYETRLAAGDEPTSLDKEYLRRYLKEAGYTGDGSPPPLPDDVRLEMSRRYCTAYERVTGRVFVPNQEPPLARIERNLSP